ncbi:hypothetical protein [Candidatus Chlorohelix sp.]|uniref:hypothetical protein n=1 Tax=Candidatus Chlorohelix sp. TaxID=3139201 RepID=UPI00304E8E32
MRELVKQFNYASQQFRLLMDNAGNGGIPKLRRVHAYEEAFAHLVKCHEIYELLRMQAGENELALMHRTLNENFKLYTDGWGRVKRVVQESRQARHERKREESFDY